MREEGVWQDNARESTNLLQCCRCWRTNAFVVVKRCCRTSASFVETWRPTKLAASFVNKIFHARTGKYKTCCKFCFWLQVLFPLRIGLRQGMTMHISQICIFGPGLTMHIFEICIIGNDSTKHITKVYHSPRKMLREKELLTTFARNEQIYCEQKFAQ